MLAETGGVRCKPASVELLGISKSYGRELAVSNLSLSLDGGRLLTLLGPSGCGKTTTLMLIAGFLRPDTGDILVGGTSMTDVPPQKRDLGMVFQNYALFPHMTVLENIAFPLRMRKASKRRIATRVDQMLELIKLPGHSGRYPRQLSGGEQQRVALARALVANPRVLLMDEPLGALDKKLRDQMQAEIRHLQRQLNITVIHVTHDQHEALTMSDLIAVMNRGQIEQLGTPLELYNSPRTRFVADFIGESNFLNGTVTSQDSERTFIATDAGLAVVARTPRDTIGKGVVTVCLRPEKLRIGVRPATMENNTTGIVRGIVFGGDTYVYKIGVGKNETLTVKVQGGVHPTVYEIGDEVALGWHDTDTVLIGR